MSHSHYNKWTSQFVDECSAFSPSQTASTRVFTERNKYQIGECQDSSYSSLKKMPQQYRRYAHSLSKKRSSERDYESFGMYNYLKSLSFVKNRHKQNCFNHCSLKKKRARKECERKHECYVPAPTHVHTVERVVVQAPPVHVHHQPILNVTEQRNFSVVRPASAPKVSVNYFSPSNVQYHQYNPIVTNPQRIFVSQKPQLVNVQPPLVNQNSLIFVRNPVQIQPQPYRVDVLPTQAVITEFRPQLTSSFVSEGTSRLFESKSSSSFRLEPHNMRASDILAYTFKHIA